jgi:DNA polymerase-3 subunit delta
LFAEAFKKEIASSNRKHFYVIKGTEPLLLAASVKAAREALSPEAAEFNFQSYNLEEDGPESILDRASASSFIPEDKIILVKVLESKKFKTEMLQGFVGWIERPTKGASIVMYYPSLKETTRLAKAAREAGLVVDCPAPTAAELPGWVAKLFQDKGLKISPEAVNVLLDRVGDNLQTLASEADKLSLWPGPKERITPKIIRENVSLNSTSVLYELSTPIAEGNMGKAAPILLDLLQKLPPFSILSVLATHFMRLFEVKVHLEDAKAEGNALPSAILSQRVEHKAYYLEILRGQAAKWTFSNLKKAIALLEESSRSFVTIATPRPIILEELCAKLCELAKGNNHE